MSPRRSGSSSVVPDVVTWAAPRGRPAPAQDRVGTDRPCGLGIAGRAGLDRRGHRPPGTRPEAPRRQRDPHHPHPPGPGPAAPHAHQAVRHDPRRAGLPDRPGRRHPGLGLQCRVGRRPRRGPRPVRHLLDQRESLNARCREPVQGPGPLPERAGGPELPLPDRSQAIGGTRSLVKISSRLGVSAHICSVKS